MFRNTSSCTPSENTYAASACVRDRGSKQKLNWDIPKAPFDLVGPTVWNVTVNNLSGLFLPLIGVAGFQCSPEL